MTKIIRLHFVVLFLLCTERAATRTKPVLEADGIVNLNGERISQCRLKLSKEEHHPRSQGPGDYHGRLIVTKFIYLICKNYFLVQIHRIGTLGKSLGRASRATFELPGFSAMSASRFLRTTTRRSDEDVMEMTPAARSASDHPSCVEFIVKMAPQSPYSDDERTMIPAAGRRNWDTTGLMPPSRHGAGHHERRHLAPRARQLLHLQDREVPQQPGQHQHLGLSPQRVKKSKAGPRVSSYSCSVQSEQQQERNQFWKQTEL